MIESPVAENCGVFYCRQGIDFDIDLRQQKILITLYNQKMNESFDLNVRKKARLPHNIFMLNLALVHLLMTPAVIAFDIGLLGMLVPLFFSLAIMLYTYKQSKSDEVLQEALLQQHWQLALKRYRLLLISYAVTAALILLGYLLAMASPDPNMQDILETVFIRIAVMPVLVMVMICFYLESSAINMVTRG